MLLDINDFCNGVSTSHNTGVGALKQSATSRDYRNKENPNPYHVISACNIYAVLALKHWEP